MNMTADYCPSLTILFAKCASGNVLFDIATLSPRNENFVANSPHDAKDMMEKTRFDYAVAFVDPATKASIHQPEGLQRMASTFDVPLASMSLFNPIWIENLMARLGIARHFRAFPDQNELTCLAARRTDILPNAMEGREQ